MKKRPKAASVILTDDEERDVWVRAPAVASAAFRIAGPGALVVGLRGKRQTSEN
jgi:hypothetical protein